MRRLKYLLLLPLGFVSAFTYAAPAFSDVRESHPHKPAIEWVALQQIFSGYEDQTFRPDAPINRAEFTKIIWQQVRPDQTPTCPSNTSPFTDVDLQAWYAGFVCQAESETWITGFDDRTFRPQNTINFVEAATILNRALQDKNQTSVEGNWFSAGVGFLSDSYAIPPQITYFSQTLNRGQVAEILYRLDKNTLTNQAQIISGQTWKLTQLSSNNVYEPLREHNLPSLISGQTFNLLFTSSDCPTCQSLNQALTQRIQELPPLTVIFQVDRNQYPDIMSKFEIEKFPALIKLDHQQKIQAKVYPESFEDL